MMPTVEVTVAGRRHLVQCGDGEEERLRRLARYLDTKVRETAGQGPPIAESRALLLGGLLATDELFDAYDEITRLKARLEEAEAAADAEAAAAVEKIAARLERLAAELEKA
jgi:cell division protein ZapA